MCKKILLIDASGESCAGEIKHLEAVAEMFKLECKKITVNCGKSLRGELDCLKDRYDFIYLAAHSSPDSFGDEANKISIGWVNFAMALCGTQCLEQESILLLGCCRGGLKRVADMLFLACNQIDYVCGPRWNACDKILAVGFHVFLFNILRREQPTTAIERASKATGQDFFHYDRADFEDEMQNRSYVYKCHCCGQNGAITPHILDLDNLNDELFK